MIELNKKALFFNNTFKNCSTLSFGGALNLNNEDLIESD